MPQNLDNHKSKCITKGELQLRCILHRLWIEHVLWTRAFIISTAADLKDLEFVTKRLLRNPVDFSNLLRQFYGNEGSLKFKELFTNHLLIAAELVNAAKAGNTQAVRAQRIKWYSNADDIAIFLSSINPYWSKREWQMMLYEHLKMTENEAVQILSQRYEESIEEYDRIQAQALRMANLMSFGIINQFNI